MNLGKVVRLCRVDKSLKQKELAELVGISVSYLSLLERNKRDPNFSLIQKIATALELPTIVMVGLAAEENELKSLDAWLERAQRHCKIGNAIQNKACS